VRQKGNIDKDGVYLAEQFARLLDLQSAICRELEQIADQLPDISDRHACLNLAQRMLPLIKRAHEFEEAQIWPILSVETTTILDIKETLNRLSFEHWGDEDFAEQVFHLLRDYAQLPEREKADALAWTLRGFFQNMQRHIAFEREFLLPLIANRE
jgi:Hemerythrin HHE cation binding domain